MKCGSELGYQKPILAALLFEYPGVKAQSHPEAQSLRNDHALGTVDEKKNRVQPLLLTN